MQGGDRGGRIMVCPDCGMEYVCPCKHCAKTFSKGKTKWVRVGEDCEMCPQCGKTLHMDQWQDVEWAQMKKEVNGAKDV